MLGLWIAELVAEFYILKEEFFSGEKARTRVLKAYIIVPIIVFGVCVLFFSFISPMQKKNKTKDKMLSAVYLLKLEKETTGKFPDDLGSFSRRNPIHGDLTVDSWDHEIFYEKTENGEDFILISKGKDGKLHTEDDIVFHKQVK
ncbi:hypothetical protein [uncultured Kordia sp.]|uniref:hypothetical protein n=1 Tax=uncultured Kordia sp. TaxID=507699 RepID=UPI002605D43B|nr:hypothetical protein [uncultured Kordia sp.]